MVTVIEDPGPWAPPGDVDVATGMVLVADRCKRFQNRIKKNGPCD
jgi:hypothetical protein